MPPRLDVGAAEHGGVRVQGLTCCADGRAGPVTRGLENVTMSSRTNCAGVTRRDCLQLGREPCSAAGWLTPCGWRAGRGSRRVAFPRRGRPEAASSSGRTAAHALRDLRPQTRGPGRDPRAVQTDRHRAPGVFYSEHLKRLAGFADGSPSCGRSVTTRATTVPATTTWSLAPRRASRSGAVRSCRSTEHGIGDGSREGRAGRTACLLLDARDVSLRRAELPRGPVRPGLW